MRSDAALDFALGVSGETELETVAQISSQAGRICLKGGWRRMRSSGRTSTSSGVEEYSLETHIRTFPVRNYFPRPWFPSPFFPVATL